ncbi:MAG TPA: hypothetical protein PKK00_15010 [Bacteroidales bacterium]|nr:hypothetical protein [Bacteroidales bacterium]
MKKLIILLFVLSSFHGRAQRSDSSTFYFSNFNVTAPPKWDTVPGAIKEQMVDMGTAIMNMDNKSDASSIISFLKNENPETAINFTFIKMDVRSGTISGINAAIKTSIDVILEQISLQQDFSDVAYRINTSSDSCLINALIKGKHNIAGAFQINFVYKIGNEGVLQINWQANTKNNKVRQEMDEIVNSAILNKPYTQPPEKCSIISGDEIYYKNIAEQIDKKNKRIKWFSMGAIILLYTFLRPLFRSKK